MTKAQEQAHKLMKTIKHDSRNKISEEFLYNAICYFEIDPEDVITLLSEMPKESCEQIATLFANTRVQVKKILEKTLSEVDISDMFNDPEIEDILFYQIAHGYEVG